jgi:hypothetical protein
MTDTTLTKCPDWCVSDNCRGDHTSDPGSAKWPSIRATGYAPGGEFTVCPHPTWGEVDGLQPCVSLWVQGQRVDESIDLTLDEARRLVACIQAAVEEARS